MGGVGVLFGALADWSRCYSVNAFKVPASLLFDYKSSSQNPKLGYLVIGVAILCVAAAFRRANSGLLVLCGLLALAASVLYMVHFSRLGRDTAFHQ